MSLDEPKMVSKDHVDDLFARLDALHKNASVKAVFGEPVGVGEKVIIPIASVSFGFASAFGEGLGRTTDQELPGGGSGAGGGASVSARPLAVAEITTDSLHIESVVDEQKVALVGILAGAWSVFWIARAVIKILRR
jgi:uncharacterized spore protein YtfJ